MKKIFAKLYDFFLGEHLEIRNRIFNMLCLSGLTLSALVFASNFWSGASFNELVLSGGTVVYAIAITIVNIKTHNYKLCSFLSVIMIFVILFPTLFFSSDGYEGGMPIFFVFAIVYTVYMLDGKAMFFAVFIETAVYVSICLFAFFNPDAILYYRSEFHQMVDIIVTFIATSFILALTMQIQFMLYKRQQRQLEHARIEAERANEAKSAFLANMSHEIRTPINIIVGMNEMIMRTSRSTQIKGYAKKINDAGVLLEALVNNVLDVAKIEAGKTELATELYEVNTLLYAIRHYGKTLCAKKGLEFKIFESTNGYDYLVGDTVIIKQIVLNLLNNAVKYTDSGSVTLSTVIEKSDVGDEANLCFSVSDTGIGIRKEEFGKIFGAFIRADEKIVEQKEGVGLGLSIVKQLLSLANGKIDVDSTLGEGSTFYVSLPQTIGQSDETSDTAKTLTTIYAPKAKILAIDDNAENLELIKILLKRTRIHIDTAMTAVECQKLVSKNQYDVVLMDYMMPDMNGDKLLMKLNEEQNFIAPTVAVTANVVSGTREFLLSSGFCDYVSKPISWKELESVLMKHLPASLYKIVTYKEDEKDAFETKSDEIHNILTSYDINIDNALMYFDGSYEQYYGSVNLFIDGAESEYSKILALYKEHDFESLFFLVHSLKSRAKNLGADKLHRIASELEPLCKEEDTREVTARMPYLLYLLEECIKGLKIVKDAFEPLIVKEEPIEEEPQNKSSSIFDLLNLVKNYRRKPALEMIDVFIDKEKDENFSKLLLEIRSKIDIMDFEEGTKLLLKYINQRNKYDIQI